MARRAAHLPSLLLLACLMVAACWPAQARKASRCEWVYAEDSTESATWVCLPASSVAPLSLKAYQAAAAKGNLAAQITSKFSALALWQGGGFYYAFRNEDGSFSMGCPPFDSFPSESDDTLYDQLELAECANGAGISNVKISEAMACWHSRDSCNDQCGCVSIKWDTYEGATPACIAKKLFVKPLVDTYGNTTLELRANFTEEQGGECAQYSASPNACNDNCACAFVPGSKCVPKGLLTTGLSPEQLEVADHIASVWADKSIELTWDYSGGHGGHTQKEAGCCKNGGVLTAMLEKGPGKVPGMTLAMRKAYGAEEEFCGALKSEEGCAAPQATLSEELIKTWATSKSPKANVACTDSP